MSSESGQRPIAAAGAGSSPSSVLDLPTWDSSLWVPLSGADGDVDGKEGDQFSQSPLPRLDAVNRRLSLAVGDVLAMRCGALVLSNNELLADTSGIAGRAFLLAGGEVFREQLQLELESVRTGEAKLSVPGIKIFADGTADKADAAGSGTAGAADELPPPMQEKGEHSGHADEDGDEREAEASFTVDTRLLCDHLVHTVGPRFNPKYQVAAESALHTSYRIALQICIAAGARTIALYPIVTVRRNYPPRDAAHVAGRTLRRFIENHGGEIDRIAMVFENEEEMQLYSEVFALYFPRTPEEERAAVDGLPPELGDPITGELVIAERKIRISRNPITRTRKRRKRGGALNVEEDDSGSSSSSASDDSSSSEDEAGLEGIDDIREQLQRTGLTRMHRSKDDAVRAAVLQKRRGVSATAGAGGPERQTGHVQRRDYPVDISKLSNSELIAHSQSAKLEEPEQWGFMRVAKLPRSSDTGSAATPKNVVVVTGCNIPPDADLNKVLLYSIRTMNDVVKEPYTLLYCHSEMADRETPSFEWLRTLHRVFDAEYGHNVRHFLVLHATFWLRMFFAVTGPFLSANFKRVMKVCGGGLREVIDVLAASGFPAYALKEALAPQVFSWDTLETGTDWSSATHAHDQL